jgi:hypothetical protein
MSERTSPAVADYSQWQAQDYFKTYYSEVVLPDEQVVLAYQIETLKRIEHPFGRGLEYGCGPTLHRAIAASRYAFRIDMADWLPDNLAQVREWVNSTGANCDWNRFTDYILACTSAMPVGGIRWGRKNRGFTICWCQDSVWTRSRATSRSGIDA